MLRSTIRQMASISGRAILAIGLTSATVLALAPSAKAADTPTADGGISVEVTAINTISYSAGSAPTPASLEAGTAVFATLTAQNNSGGSWKIRATSQNASKLQTTGTAQNSLGYKVITVAGTTGTAAAGTFTDPAGVALPSSGTTGLLYTTSTTSELNPVTINVKILTDASFSTVKSGTYTDTITYTIAGS
jgi:hypothetical protein